MDTDAQALEVRSEPIQATLAFPLRTREALLVLAALALGSITWNMPPLGGLSESGSRFLATLIVAISLWVFEVFDEYIVGFMLLLAWVVLDVAPAKIALAGFSENAWLFTVGALGIAAAIGKTTLLQRLSERLLSWIPIRRQKTYMFSLLSAGILSGPLLPTGKARAAVAVPIAQAISQAAGFSPRSNGSAAIALAAFVGFSQMSFIFLTGSFPNLIAWNFLPPAFKAEFGWLTWFLAALPAAVCISVFMFWSMRALLPLSPEEKQRLAANAAIPLKDNRPLTGREWMTLGTLLLTVAGWMTSSLHGVNEAWIALTALLVFLLTGVLDQKGFKTGIDWGLIMFFGVLNSIAVIAEHVKVDAWFMALSGQVLAPFAGNPLAFLLAVCLLVSAVRFLLRKGPTAALVGVAVLPLSEIAGIHPGVVLVAALMAGECLLFAYQDGPYQIAYGGTGGKAFSHGQARKVLGAKYLATILAVAVSVPYWRFLGFIH
jgi:anion transporter